MLGDFYKNSWLPYLSKSLTHQYQPLTFFPRPSRQQATSRQTENWIVTAIDADCAWREFQAWGAFINVYLPWNPKKSSNVSIVSSDAVRAVLGLICWIWSIRETLMKKVTQISWIACTTRSNFSVHCKIPSKWTDRTDQIIEWPDGSAYSSAKERKQLKCSLQHHTAIRQRGLARLLPRTGLEIFWNHHVEKMRLKKAVFGSESTISS